MFFAYILEGNSTKSPLAFPKILSGFWIVTKTSGYQVLMKRNPNMTTLHIFHPYTRAGHKKYRSGGKMTDSLIERLHPLSLQPYYPASARDALWQSSQSFQLERLRQGQIIFRFGIPFSPPRSKHCACWQAPLSASSYRSAPECRKFINRPLTFPGRRSSWSR